MNKLPFEVIIHIYSCDPTYKYIIDKILISLKVHCFMYRCYECYKPYNQCFCYCQTCSTYLRFCKQLYYDSNSMTEDDIKDLVGLNS